MLYVQYMEDTKVDILIQSLVRGVGLSFTSKSSFVEHANNLLSDVGFMLVRVPVAGKRYYSLRDLDSMAIGEDPQRDTNISFISQDDLRTPTRKLRDCQSAEMAVLTQNSAVSESRHTTPFKLHGSKFTNSELLIFIDCINIIIETRKPLRLKGNGTMYTWCYICNKRSLIDERSQISLFRRFERKKWLECEDSGMTIVPGVRFYFELTDVFDLRNLKTCEMCKGLIVYHQVMCSVCHGSVHGDCMGTNRLDMGNDVCPNCDKVIL